MTVKEGMLEISWKETVPRPPMDAAPTGDIPSEVSMPFSGVRLTPRFFRRLVPFVLAMLTFATASSGWGQSSLDLQEETAFKQAAALAEPSIVQIQTVGGLDVVDDLLTTSGPTTGVVVSDDGLIITSSFNFLGKPSSVIVLTSDGRKLPAEIVAFDKARKLTLLKIETGGKSLTPLTAAPKKEFKVGQWGIALGRTYDIAFPNMAVGVVSALDRIYGKAVQTDAKVSPANYGGPLVDLEGRGIGILVPMSPQEDTESAGVEWYDGGIAFAVPLEDIYKVLPRLKAGETLLPGLMGVSFSDSSPLSGEAKIDRVRPESPGAKAGLKVGDVITQLDSRPIDRIPTLRHDLGSRYAGDTVKVTFRRGSETLTRDVMLASVLLPYESGFLGILPARPVQGGPVFDGVLIRSVLEGSPAAEAKLAAGDRIVSINGTRVPTAVALQEQVGRIKPKEKATIEYFRGTASQSVEVTLSGLPNELSPSASPVPIPTRPADADLGGRKVGRFEAQIPGEDRKFWAYVPEGYHPDHEYGLVVWIHPGGDTLEADFLKAWQAEADKRGLILVGPRAADVARWAADDADYVKGVVEWTREQYAIAPERIVVHSHGDGGFGWLIGFRQREAFRGLLISGVPLKSPPPDNDPEFRQQILAVSLGPKKLSDAVKLTVEALREFKFPTALLEGSKEPKYPADLAGQFAAWIDQLDRI